MQRSAQLILSKLKTLAIVLNQLAVKHKYTPAIGRTHGIHAEPTTFGLKILGWYSEINRHITMMKHTITVVSYGKMSGAVGNLAHNSPETELFVCNKLGLKPEPVSTQVVPRDRYATYFMSLALIASSIERFATEIRHLQRSEVKEVEESFTAGQKGSSAMPHKRNPVLSENLCGLARLVRSYVTGAMENVSLWHERDISHSSYERIALPDSSIALDFMITRFTGLVSNLTVYPDTMQKNLDLTKGLVFSERLLLELIMKGLTRKQAYAIVQTNAFEALNKNVHLRQVVIKNKQMRKYLSQKVINDCFSLTKFFKNIDKIFSRTIGDKKP
jgi:adenylosuccinate lyase